MAEILGALAFLSALLLGWFASVRAGRTRRQRKALEAWGKPPAEEPMDGDALEDIKSYWLALRSGETEHSAQDIQDASFVDDITWNDLDMDTVFRFLDRTRSNLGQEVLYAMLREIGVSGKTLQRRERWMEVLEKEPKGRGMVQERLGRLGKERYHGAQEYLFRPKGKRPAHGWVYPILALIPLLCIVLGFFWPLFFIGLAISFILNMIVFYTTHATWGTQQAAIRHLGGVLWGAGHLKKLLPPGMEDLGEELDSLWKRLRPMARWNGLFAMQGMGDVKVIVDYVRIAFQLDMISLTRLAAFIGQNRVQVARLYALVGELDACQAVASVRASFLGAYVQPEFRDGLRVQATGLAHPLVAKPVRNTMEWQQNGLITGSNASGKSTFIKAMAVNAILAQSICTCWAKGFVMPRARVMSSMALRDNLQGGESYFIIEIKSLRRILSALGQGAPILCFVDEILRGTNTVERIAASCALLRYLEGENILCLAATHDLELTQLLTGYRQYHFREEMTGEGMHFSYRLMDGPSNTRNAIRLLEQMAFPPEVIREAGRLAAHFDESGKWCRAHRDAPKEGEE